MSKCGYCERVPVLHRHVLRAEESVDRLLLGCETTQGMWMALLNLFNHQWVLPSKLMEHFLAWRNVAGE